MTEDLIEKFFRKECTAEEAAEVMEHFKRNKHTLDRYLDKKEWDEVETSAMPQELWDDIWEAIEKKKKTHAAILWIKRSSIAACIVGLIAVAYYNFPISKRADYSNARDSIESNVIAATEHKTIINNSGKTERILLPDSSVINLAKGSVVKFDVPFQSNAREIELEGDAYFKVAKDATKPFTVFAGALATTALGTEFKITTSDEVDNVKVQLFEGKVVIKSTNSSMKGWNKDVYLLPGEQLRYDTHNFLTAVEKIKKTDKRLAAGQKGTKSKNSNYPEVNSDLVFSSASLDLVMEKLSKFYDVKIEYNKSDIEAMSFTGTITKNDSLPVILKVIAQMNDLQIAPDGNRFVVERMAGDK